MRFDDKTFLVVGTGKSGISAVSLLMKEGAEVIINDSNDKLDIEEVKSRFEHLKHIEEVKSESSHLEHAEIERVSDIRIVLGDIDEDILSCIDIAVISPGVPIDSPLVLKLKERSIPVWGEIELAYVCAKGALCAITGTNGKTTTTALTGEIMKEYCKDVYVVGNIGVPYTDYALNTNKDSMTVAEISSFQLETIHQFKPDISAVLNITPDHLNRHHTMECYINTKLDIAKNQTKDDICILNYDDENLRKAASNINAKVFWFSSRHILERGIWLEGEDIFYKDDSLIKICTIHDMKLLGRHNYENVMAAVAIAMHAGVPVESIRNAVKDFNAVEHRIEFVREVKGVKYYNDSKGTNPDAAIKAVEAMISPTVVIGGGYDKQSDYGEWIDSFKDRVKCLVLLGATAEKIEKAAFEKGFTNIIKTSSLEEAVKVSSEQAVPGDAVLLSPACASWGMFKNYEERGRLFKEYVGKL